MELYEADWSTLCEPYESEWAMMVGGDGHYGHHHDCAHRNDHDHHDHDRCYNDGNDNYYYGLNGDQDDNRGNHNRVDHDDGSVHDHKL